MLNPQTEHNVSGILVLGLGLHLLRALWLRQ